MPASEVEQRTTRGLIDCLTFQQQAELHVLTRMCDEALLLNEEGDFIYVRRPDLLPFIHAFRKEQP